MSTFQHQHLLGIKQLSGDDIQLILQTAENFKQVINRPIKKVPTLRDMTIANIFFENSTRTRVSFELAERRLSADIVNFTSSSSSVSKGETLVDTVRNIQSMKVDMVVMRHPGPGACIFLAKHVKASIINAGDGTHEHPTQALLDTFSIQEKLGDLKGKKIAIVGDILHSRVALSNIFCLLKMGASVKVCGPPTLIPRFIETLGVEVDFSLDRTLLWADAVNMLRIQMERQGNSYFPSIREYSMQYGLTLKRYEASGRQPLILHPGPINRGVELSSDLADSPHAIILDQVENGVAVRMAVLYLLANKVESIA
jgi:aspartate carbamoyltransferase catalytic subunit